MKNKINSANNFKGERGKTLNAYSLAGIGIGVIMSQVLGSMTSISTNRPVRGSFRVYTEEFLGRHIGFLLG